MSLVPSKDGSLLLVRTTRQTIWVFARRQLATTNFSRTTQLKKATLVKPEQARRAGKSIWYTYVFIQCSKHLADDTLGEEGHGIPLHKGRREDGAETFACLS